MQESQTCSLQGWSPSWDPNCALVRTVIACIPLQHGVKVAEGLLLFKILFRSLLTCLCQGCTLSPHFTEGIFSHSFQQNSVKEYTEQRNLHTKKKSMSLVPHKDLHKKPWELHVALFTLYHYAKLVKFTSQGNTIVHHYVANYPPGIIHHQGDWPHLGLFWFKPRSHVHLTHWKLFCHYYYFFYHSAP